MDDILSMVKKCITILTYMNIQFEGSHASKSDIRFKFVPLQYCIKGAKMHQKKRSSLWK